MNEFEFYLTDSLEKVFPDRMPSVIANDTHITIFQGEVPAVQLVYRKKDSDMPYNQEFLYEVEGFPEKARVRDVELVPSAFPCYRTADENYLSVKPGLFPDLLKPRKDHVIIPLWGQYRALWIDFPVTEKVIPGTYRIQITIRTNPVITLGNGRAYHPTEKEKDTFHISFYLDVLNRHLPEQKLIHTEWFYADCLANYYHVEVFSKEHWRIIENQMMMAGKELGINMLLTPVFTPPLDTAIGGERRTVQLVDITFSDHNYTFDFTKLKRWCRLCHKYEISYIEIPHLFTQWGAKATPKIEVYLNGAKVNFFGWHMPACSREYKSFLEQFLPALQRELTDLGYDKEHVFFHISDEPVADDIEDYAAAKELVSELLADWNVIDALSDYTFYEKGLVRKPVVSNDHIQTFVDHEVSGLWTYYCCGQDHKVPNRFFAMPSARNRIMGVLMYLYDIQGFLHWGYNFYNTMFSKEAVDPFFDTHSSYAFPSGDSFLVYPGKDGQVWSSIRAEVQREALYDLRALCALETIVGRERVEEIIYEGETGPFTFESYPKDREYLFQLRERVALEVRRICD